MSRDGVGHRKTRAQPAAARPPSLADARVGHLGKLAVFPVFPCASLVSAIQSEVRNVTVMLELVSEVSGDDRSVQCKAVTANEDAKSANYARSTSCMVFCSQSRKKTSIKN